MKRQFLIYDAHSKLIFFFFLIRIIHIFQLFNAHCKCLIIIFDYLYILYSRPAETKILHEDGGLVVKYSPNAEHIVASIGRPDVTMVVSHLKSELPLLVAPLKLFGGLCWHARLAYICGADDSKLCFWKTLLK